MLDVDKILSGNASYLFCKRQSSIRTSIFPLDSLLCGSSAENMLAADLHFSIGLLKKPALCKFLVFSLCTRGQWKSSFFFHQKNSRVFQSLASYIV